MSKNSIKVFGRSSRKAKGTVVSFLKEVKTDGTPEQVKKAIATLQKEKTSFIEVVDSEKQLKTMYKITVSGNNYEQKTVKI